MSDYIYATADEAVRELKNNPSKYQTLESLLTNCFTKNTGEKNVTK